MKFWNFFLKNKAFTYFLVFLTVISGAFSISSIPKESTPEITIPIVTITTPFFGASSSDVESLVTNEIESSISTITDIKTYTSTSKAGISNIVVEFEQGVDIDERLSRVKEAVDGTKGQLPADGNDPIVRKVEFSSQPVLSLSLVSNLPPYSFQKVMDQLEKELESIDGVAQVSYSGIPEREISVITDNRKLIEKDLDFSSVSRAISGGNVKLPVGSVKINSVDYPLDLKAEVKNFDDLQFLPVSGFDSSLVLLSDVAKIINGYKESDKITRVGISGLAVSGAVNVDVVKKKGGDITKITREVREKIESLKEDLLYGVDSVITYDAGEDIEKDLIGLTKSGLQTVALVFFVLLVAVGFRESVIAAVSIPLSFMLAFLGFIVVGNTINFISLFSLILSIGILVDTAIVVVEGINKKVQEGKRREAAATATIKEFGLPLIAGTMTTIAVFFPLLFLSGITGQFISGIPYTVIFVLVSSLFVALAYVTLFCAAFLKNRDEVEKDSLFIRLFSKIERVYGNLLDYLLERSIPRRLFQAFVVIIFFLSLGLVGSGLIKVEFFPGGDLEFAYVEVELPAGSPLESTSDYAAKVESILQEAEYIESFVTTIGQTSIFSNEVLVGDNYGNISINIKREFQSEGIPLLDPLRKEIENNDLVFAELTVAAGGPPGGAPIDVNFTSEETDVLRLFVLEAEKRLKEIDGVNTIESTLAGNNSGFEVTLDRNAAYRFGVDIGSIANAIRGATDGLELFDITESGDDVPVVIRNRLSDFESNSSVTKNIDPNLLKKLTVKNNRGEDILLGSLIDIKLSGVDSEINHEDSERTETITAEVDEGFNAIELREQYRTALDEIEIDGVSFAFGGEAAEQDQSFAEMGIAFIAGVFLMFSILILQFGRWRQTIIILSVLPFAFTGVLIGLFISGNALSFPAMLGLIALSGIVVNNSIILVSVFNNLREENPEMELKDAVRQGAVLRLRPVLLTTFTTIVGVTPLLTSSAIWAPIAYSIIFGLLFCIFVTLAMVPLLYMRFEGFRYSGWRNVGSFYLNVLVILLIPALVAFVLFGLIKNISGKDAFAALSALIILIYLMYKVTHIRRHH